MVKKESKVAEATPGKGLAHGWIHLRDLHEWNVGEGDGGDWEVYGLAEIDAAMDALREYEARAWNAEQGVGFHDREECAARVVKCWKDLVFAWGRPSIPRSNISRAKLAPRGLSALLTPEPTSRRCRWQAPREKIEAAFNESIDAAIEAIQNACLNLLNCTPTDLVGQMCSHRHMREVSGRYVPTRRIPAGGMVIGGGRPEIPKVPVSRVGRKPKRKQLEQEDAARGALLRRQGQNLPIRDKDIAHEAGISESALRRNPAHRAARKAADKPYPKDRPTLSKHPHGHRIIKKPRNSDD